jgi:hypothetical protein
MANDIKSQIRAATQPAIDRLVDDLSNAMMVVVSKTLQAALVGAANGVSKPVRKAASAPRRAHGRRDMGCIAPGCKNRSKGPRFSYLCEKHLPYHPPRAGSPR